MRARSGGRPLGGGDERSRVLPSLLSEIEAQASRKVRKLAERAVAAAKEEFVRGMYHEAMKPLGGLLRFVDESKPDYRPVLPDARATTVEDADVHVQYLLAILSRARELVLTYRAHHCRELLEPLVDDARRAVEKRLGARAGQLELVTDIPSDLSLHADHPVLVEALVEIFANAVEAYDPAAARAVVTVAARIRRKGSVSFVEIEVADRGRGMSEESIERFFVGFASSKRTGTGLGNLIARKNIEQMHGGTMTVESARGGPERGTRIRISLPKKQPKLRAERRLTLEQVILRGVLPGPEARELLGAGP